MKRFCYFSLLAAFLVGFVGGMWGSVSAQTAVIGSGTSAHSGTESGPINIWWRSRRCQMVYTAAEIYSALGNPNPGPLDITKLGFYVTGSPLYSLPNFRVRLKHTTATNAATLPDNNSLTTVYTNASYSPVSGGFDMLNFSQMFNWDGTSNLLVDVCFDQVSPQYDQSGTVRVFSQPNGLWSSYSDNFSQCGQTNSSTTTSYKPQIRIDFVAPVPMVVLNDFTTQNNQNPVAIGTQNADILQFSVLTYGSLSPLTLTQLNFSTAGSTNAADLAGAKLYSSGFSANFADAVLVDAVTNPSGAFAFNTNITLLPGQNYFWLRYDIAPNAVSGHLADAALTSYSIDGQPQTPSTVAPAGARKIVDPYAELSYFQGFENEWISFESQKDLPTVNWLNTPASGNSSWRRSDDGASAGWTNAGSGSYAPTGSAAQGAESRYSARFHTQSSNVKGNLDLYLNFNQAGNKLLNFDYINPGGTDRLFVLLSTNAGGSFDTIGVYFTTSGWQRYENISLGASVSPTCILRFQGVVVNSSSSDLGLDNVFVRLEANRDVAVTQILAPNSGCGLSATEKLTVVVKNFGLQPAANFQLGFRVNGGAVQTAAYSGAALAPNDTVHFTFQNQNANLSAAGDYTLQAFTQWTQDQQIDNDTSSIFEPKSVTKVPTVSVFPYLENFENGAGGWRSGGDNNSWAFGQPNKPTINTAASGQNAWVTGGLSSGSYNNNEESFVLSPCFDFTSLKNPIVRLKFRQRFEVGFDGAVLQASIDGGATWTRVGEANAPAAWNWYNDADVSATPGGQSQGWADKNTDWTTAKNQLKNLGGKPSVVLRIAFASESSGVDEGFAFDDFEIYEGPIVTLGQDKVICQGQSVTLNAGGGFSQYLWSNNATASAISVTLPDLYIVQVTDAEGFTARDTVQVSVSAVSAELAPVISVCDGEVVVLNVANTTAGITYLWSNNATTPAINVTQTGVYSVTVTNALGCEAAAESQVIFYENPAVELGANASFCVGGSLVLKGGTGLPTTNAFLWNTGANTENIVVTAPGKYWVDVVTLEGCKASDTVFVDIKPTPFVNLGQDYQACDNLNLTLDAQNPGAAYLWNTGQTTRTILATQPGVYSVQVTNSIGCVAEDTLTITLNPANKPNLGEDRTVCGSATLNGPVDDYFTYVWSTGETTRDIVVDKTGDYTLYVTNLTGCTASNQVKITVQPALNAQIYAKDTVRLNEPVLFLDASFPEPNAWNWNFANEGADTKQNPTFRFQTSGLKEVTLSANLLNCTDQATRYVYVTNEMFVGLDAEAFGSWNLYPNPTQGQLNLQFAEPLKENVTLKVFDVWGQQVYQTSLEAGQQKTQFALPDHLAAGVYLLELYAPYAATRARIVKQ